MRRTPLVRRTPPLQRTKNAARKKRGSSSGKLTRPAPSEFTPRVKLQIRKRAGRGDVFEACCESCGVWLGEKGGEFSHRDPLGMGGSRNRVTNSAANGTLACGSGALKTGCHGLCEMDDERMKAMGFRLRNGQDPRTTPVRWHGGDVSWYLAEDGIGDTGYGYSYSAPQAGVAEDGAS